MIGFTSQDTTLIHELAPFMRQRAIDGEVFLVTSGLSLYHAHLKISDIDIDSTQPLEYEDIIVAFVGEIYNKKYLLELCSESDRDVSEATTIAICYKKFGSSFVRFLNGEFVIYIFDTKIGKHLLYRDRYGVHALYYTLHDSVMYFASEMMPLIQITYTPSPVGLLQYSIFGFTLSPYTPIDDLYILAPGMLLEYDSHKSTLKKVVFASYEPQERLPTFIDAFERSVQRRIPMHQRKLLLPLSGGKDSALTLFFTKKHFTGKIVAYTFSNQYNHEDVHYAKNTSKKLDIEHYTIDLETYAPENIPPFFLHEAFVFLPDLHGILRQAIPDPENEFRVEISGDGREEFFYTNTHFDYKKIQSLYTLFSGKGRLPDIPLSHQALNEYMFDFNLQIIEKLSLNRGIERRLPFTDYELLPFRQYPFYQQDSYDFLSRQGIEIVPGRYGHNDGVGFRYMNTQEFHQHFRYFLSFSSGSTL